MNKSKFFAYALAAWLVLEALAFVIVVELFGDASPRLQTRLDS